MAHLARGVVPSLMLKACWRSFRPLFLFCLLSFGICCELGAVPGSSAPLRIVGSSAMYPFLVAVAERFGYAQGERTPIVEATGTGGGIKSFCSKRGPESPSLVAASRPMTEKERAFCRQQGIVSLLEIPLGLDGLVLATPKNQGTFLKNVTLKELFRAVSHPPSLSKQALPVRWSDITPRLPSVRLKILVPSTASGTREAFEALVLKGIPARQDRVLRSAADQETVLVQKLLKTQEAVGVLSYAYLEKNRTSLEPIALEGILPTRATIRSKAYPLVRRVYVYVKGEHWGLNKALAPFVAYLLDPRTENLLAENGLIPLGKEERQKRQHQIDLFRRAVAR